MCGQYSSIWFNDLKIKSGRGRYLFGNNIQNHGKHRILKFEAYIIHFDHFFYIFSDRF